MKNVTYKADKLIRLEYEIEDGVLRFIRITGDFFVHPEEKLKIKKKGLLGVMVDGIPAKFDSILGENDIEVIGFNGDDLKAAIMKDEL